MTRQRKRTRVTKNANKEVWKYATWNVRGLSGKEQELCYEFNNLELDVLTLTETKKKGQRETILEEGHILILSGVPQEKRAAAGVGCLINKKMISNIRKWEGHSERILTVELSLDQEIVTIIVIYGPNEDEKAEVKDKFWEQLNEITENCKGKIIVAGDMNGRVGRKETYTGVIGKHGEETKNNNGTRLIEYCLSNNLIVTNTFYQHKDIHKFTRRGPNNELSIIDYILVEKDNKKEIKDVRARRGPELYTDHYMVLAKVNRKTNRGNEFEIKEKIKEFTSIRTYKLRNAEIAKRYQDIVESKMEELKLDTNDGIEECWKNFKKILLESARETCGEMKGRSGTKQTAWWNAEIKNEVKIKKEKWKDYLRNKTEIKHEIYKEQRRKVNKMVKQAKEKSWIEFGKKMENNSKENQKLFYRTLKSVRAGKATIHTPIMDKEGETITDDNQTMNRWKQYFEQLLNIEDNVNEINRNEEQPRTVGDEERLEPITKDEVKKAINTLKNGKAPGHDRLTTEMMKNLGEKGIELFWKICNKAWEEGKIPEDWKIGQIVPIHKKGNTRDCNNYRGLTLLSTAAKTYERILEGRLKGYVDPTLEETQSAFRKGRGVQDHIFTVKQIIEKTILSATKSYFAFIDLEKAFDRVQRKIVWSSLEKRRVDNKLITAIKSMYKQNTNYVISKNRKSDKFEIKGGLRQGGVLSPILFNVFIDEILKECKPYLKKLCVGFKNLEPIELTECMFADDLVIMANSEKGLQNNINIWNNTLKKYGMKINTTKTCVMMVTKGQEEEMNIRIENEKIQQVEQIKYLGVTIERNGNQDIDVSERIRKTVNIYHAMRQTFIRKKEISQKTKMTVFRTIYRPILTYGSETWVLTKKNKSRLQAIEMKYLRGVKGITRRDKARNIDVREELQVESIIDFIEKKQLGWWGHLQRMEECIPAKRMWTSRIKAKRGPGRPKLTWEKEVAKLIENRGQTVLNAKEIARDKKQWKKFVHETHCK